MLLVQCVLFCWFGFSLSSDSFMVFGFALRVTCFVGFCCWLFGCFG